MINSGQYILIVLLVLSDSGKRRVRNHFILLDGLMTSLTCVCFNSFMISMVLGRHPKKYQTVDPLVPTIHTTAVHKRTLSILSTIHSFSRRFRFIHLRSLLLETLSSCSIHFSPSSTMTLSAGFHHSLLTSIDRVFSTPHFLP